MNPLSLSNSLYQLSAEWSRVQQLLDETEGEVTDAIAQALDGLELAFPAKVDGVLKVMETFEQRAKMRKAVAARILGLAARDEQGVARLKAYLMDCMRLANIRKLETEAHLVSVCRNSQPSIRWTGTNPKDLPKEFQKVIVDVNMEAARAYLKEFGSLPGEFEVHHGEHLRIK